MSDYFDNILVLYIYVNTQRYSPLPYEQIRAAFANHPEQLIKRSLSHNPLLVTIVNNGQTFYAISNDVKRKVER
jgi:hypothetical protein